MERDERVDRWREMNGWIGRYMNKRVDKYIDETLILINEVNGRRKRRIREILDR